MVCQSPVELLVADSTPKIHGVVNVGLQFETGNWAEDTFPRSTSKSICKHLEEEIEEFLDDESPEEAADIVLLLMHHAYKNGYDLLAEAREKLEKNQSRTWATEPNEKGYFKHIDLGVET